MVVEPQNRFTRRQTVERGSVRLGFFIFLAIVASIGWLYVFFMSDLFRIKKIEIVGGKGIDTLDTQRIVYEAIDARPHHFWEPTRHSLFLKPNELEPLLTERLQAEHVSVDKPSFDVLRLMIQARVARFILHTPTQELWLDSHGIVLSELTLQEQQDVNARLTLKRLSKPTDPPIFSYSPLMPLQINQGIPDPQIRTWLALALQIQKQGISYREIQPPEGTSSTKMVIKTIQGYDAWFDTSQDTLQMQIEAFKAFQQQKPKDVAVKEYIDVRIPDRVYVK